MNDRDKQLWAWLSQLPIEFNSMVFEVNIKPLIDRASQIVEERNTPTEYSKSIWTADSRSAPAFKKCRLDP